MGARVRRPAAIVLFRRAPRLIVETEAAKSTDLVQISFVAGYRFVCRYARLTTAEISRRSHGLLSNPRTKDLSEDAFSLSSDEQGWSPLQSARPPILHAVGADRGTHNSGEVRSSLAPVEAGAAQDTTRPVCAVCQHGVGIDPDCAQKRDPGLGEDAGIAGQLDMTVLDQSIGQGDPQLSRKMIPMSSARTAGVAARR